MTKPKPVLSVDSWNTNGDLVADALVRLGYLKVTDHVLDPTFGDNGVFWKRWRPDRLTAVHDDADFRHLAYPDASFDAVVFDPPYTAIGGRETSGIKEMHARYGMDGDDCRNPQMVQNLINDGLTEMVRLVRPARTKKEGGLIFVKCKNYIWSANFWPGVHLTRDHAMSLGLMQVDEFVHYGTPGPQPKRTRADGLPSKQEHARSNSSALLVFRRLPVARRSRPANPRGVVPTKQRGTHPMDMFMS